MLLCAIKISVAQTSVIEGRMYDSEIKPLPNVHVVNLSKSRGVFSKIDGAFEIQVEVGDTLFFTHVSHDDRYLFVSDSLLALEKRQNVSMYQATYELNEITINQMQSYKSYLRQKRITQRPVIGVDDVEFDHTPSSPGIENVLTLLYQQLNRVERNKAKLPAAKYRIELIENLELRIRYLLAKQNRYKERDEFEVIRQCNLNPYRAATWTNYELYKILEACWP